MLSRLALAGGYSASKAAFWSITNSLRLDAVAAGEVLADQVSRDVWAALSAPAAVLYPQLAAG